MTDSFTIGDWKVEPARGCLVASKQPALEVRLEPKAMQVLLALAARRGEVVTKKDLVSTVWQDAFVGDQVLVNAIWELRRAFGDDSKNPRYIQTIPRRGYRLTAEVHDQVAADKGRDIRIAAALLTALGAALVAVWLWPRQPVSEPPPIVRFEVEATRSLGPLYVPALALSDDASKLVLTVRSGSSTQLLLRRFDRLEEVPITGTEGASAPFFSPDGRRVGFFADDELRQVTLDGDAPPVVLAEVGVTRGASWGSDGMIYFARGSGGGLWRVAEDGGQPEPVTELAVGEWTHRWP